MSEMSNVIMKENSELAVSTEALSKSYGNVQALKSLNLKVPKGSIFGLLGPNGSGKTTTIKLLLGLVRPTSGRGTLLGEDIEKDSVEVRSRIGYLAQVPSYYDYMSARETLLFKLRFYVKGDKYVLGERVDEILSLVELDDKADRPIRGFSGGERQRLGIAQAMVHNPDLLILDEPAASLDPMGRLEVLSLLEKLRGHSTVIYSTHILDDVQHVSDTVAILNRGVLMAEAPIDELLNGSGTSTYCMTVKGQCDSVYEKIRAQPWVKGVEVLRGGPKTTLEIGVTDEGRAEDELVRLVAGANDLTVTEFTKRRVELEEVFMKIVEGWQG
jgi:ABC-2 type transport system ATP-binding protein